MCVKGVAGEAPPGRTWCWRGAHADSIAATRSFCPRANRSTITSHRKRKTPGRGTRAYVLPAFRAALQLRELAWPARGNTLVRGTARGSGTCQARSRPTFERRGELLRSCRALWK